MFFTVLLRLLSAHLLSDFILQTDGLVQNKVRKDGKRYLFLFFHSLIHAVVAYLLLGFWSNWIIPFAIFLSHFVIDSVKVKCKDGVPSFLIDQFFHIAIIVLLALYATDSFRGAGNWLNDTMGNRSVWIYLLAYVAVLKPSSVFLSLFIRKWAPDSEKFAKSLPSAGQWIGYLERILILTFIFTDNPEGIGFLLAAKSIFRFGELRSPKEIKVTEYVLIGTLSSFAVAIMIGYLSKLLM